MGVDAIGGAIARCGPGAGDEAIPAGGAWWGETPPYGLLNLIQCFGFLAFLPSLRSHHLRQLRLSETLNDVH